MDLIIHSEVHRFFKVKNVGIEGFPCAILSSLVFFQLYCAILNLFYRYCANHNVSKDTQRIFFSSIMKHGSRRVIN